ncbi:MAG: hypothetical protein GX761_00335, partial [Gammaproteobacteria bacterium]|nr:hypothetical protein [Gammaproteobacteria bacterium]
MEVEVVLALPRECRAARLSVAEGTTAGEAAAASGLPLEGIEGYAVFGERVRADAPLRDGDRLELLRPPLRIDMHLREGPFRKLEGRWQFHSL